MASNFKQKKKTDTPYLIGKKHGESDAYEYKKRNSKTHMSFWKAINPISSYAEQFIKGYNDGYFEIVNGRKMIRASQKIETLKKQEKSNRLTELKKLQAQKQEKSKGKER